MLSRQKLEKIAKKVPQLELLFLFGSNLEKNKKPNDIDFALLLKEPLENKLDLLTLLHESLQELTPQEIDISILNSAGTVLKYQVAKKGKLLFERKKGMSKKFRINTLKEFFDFQPTLDFFYNKKIGKAHG